MKEYSDGNTDIRRITLKRKNVGRHCGESFKDRMPDSSGQEFFATDYFDVMSVERKSSADDFTDIMGVCAEDAVVDDEVSVQSFVLYENGIRCLTENPFDVSDEEKKKAPFLSIIPPAPFPTLPASFPYPPIASCKSSCFWAKRTVLDGSSFRRLFTYRSWLWVFFMELFTSFSDLSSPLVSPPISTVIPLTRLAMCHHPLKKDIKNARIIPSSQNYLK